MEINKPSFTEAFLISLLVMTTYFLIPQRVLIYSTISCIILVFYGTGLKNMAGPAIKLALVWCGFISLVSFGRYLGGIKAIDMVRQAFNSVSLFLSVSLSLTLLASVRPISILKTLDVYKVPRAFSYVYLSVGTLVETVSAVGERQLNLLKLKGLVSTNLLGKIHSYWRLLGPMFSVLLSRQLAHARSLQYRGFFSSRYPGEIDINSISRPFIRLAAFLIGNILFWIGVAYCVL